MISTETVINISAVMLAGIALVFSWITYLKTREYEKLVVIDNRLFEILDINMQHPEFDDPELTNNYENYSKKKIAKQYEIFVMIVWNFLELIFLYYGKQKIKTTPFWGAFEYWSVLHYH